jgi:dihydrofolate reductase
MSDTAPQTADGKVLFHFAMSLDGFVAGPDHGMDWMTGVSVRPGLHNEYIATIGAILGGRKGWDQAIDGRSGWRRPTARTSRCSRPPSAASCSSWD